MSDIVTEANRLADYKTRLYNRLIAQGDTVIQPNDSMDTYISRYERLRAINNKNITVTANGVYNIDAANGYTGNGIVTVNVTDSSTINRIYGIGDRIYEDIDGLAIGTIGAIYTDNNDVEYAVCVLDSTYRLPSTKWMDQAVAVTDLPQYSSNNTAAFGFGSESATFNCDKILAMTSYTSDAVNHCRSKSFIINGVTYYGQLPNVCELCQIYANHYKLGQLDTTESSAANNVKLSSWFAGSFCWSSSQYRSSDAWGVYSNGNAYSGTKTGTCMVCPVLEIPNVLA